MPILSRKTPFRGIYPWISQYWILFVLLAAALWMASLHIFSQGPIIEGARGRGGRAAQNEKRKKALREAAERRKKEQQKRAQREAEARKKLIEQKRADAAARAQKPTVIPSPPPPPPPPTPTPLANGSAAQNPTTTTTMRS